MAKLAFDLLDRLARRIRLQIRAPRSNEIFDRVAEHIVQSSRGSPACALGWLRELPGFRALINLSLRTSDGVRCRNCPDARPLSLKKAIRTRFNFTTGCPTRSNMRRT